MAFRRNPGFGARLAKFEHPGDQTFQYVATLMFLSHARNVVSGLSVGETVCNGGALPRSRAIVANVTVLFFLGLVGLAVCRASDAAAGSQKAVTTNSLTVEQFEQLRANQDFVVLDVRKSGDYLRGHIPGAINIDCGERDFDEKIAALDKHHPYLLHGRTERHADEVVEKLGRLHFARFFTLKGGFEAWQDAGKPVEKFGVKKPSKN